MRTPQIALALVAIMAPQIALSAGPGRKADGVFVRSGEAGLTLHVVTMDEPNGFAASLTTSGGRGCEGHVGLFGKATSDREIAFSRPIQDAGECKVRVRFNPALTAAEVESDGCSFFHGASCDFNGSVKRAR